MVLITMNNRMGSPLLQPFSSLHLRHNSFSNPSVALPTSQRILQPFRCFIYVTAHSPTLLSLLLCHWLFTSVTWRAAHYSMWVSWWTKWIWVGFYRGFCRFPFLQISFQHFSTLISFISFHFISSAPAWVRQAWSAGTLAIHKPSIRCMIASYPCVGHELKIFFICYFLCTKNHIQNCHRSHHHYCIVAYMCLVSTFQTLNSFFMAGMPVSFYIKQFIIYKNFII